MKRLLIITAAIFVSACTPEAPLSPPLSDEPVPVNASQAKAIFESVCASSAPSFSGYSAAVGGTDFNYEPVGTLYRHSTLDLTVALLEGNRRCTMTFLSSDDPLRLASSLAGTVTPLTDADGSFISGDGSTTTSLRDGGEYRFEPLAEPNTYAATLDYAR